MTVSNVTFSLDVVGRCDDGSDETITNPKVAENAVLNGIGRLELIRTVRLKVAFRNKSESVIYMLSRAWTVLSTIHHLPVG